SGATVREPDGGAMSSRNRYLTPDERATAPALSRALRAAQAALEAGEKDFARIEREAVRALEQAGLAPEYVEVRRAVELGKAAPGDAPSGLIVLGAARLGRARLIDNTSR